MHMIKQNALTPNMVQSSPKTMIALVGLVWVCVGGAMAQTPSQPEGAMMAVAKADDGWRVSLGLGWQRHEQDSHQQKGPELVGVVQLPRWANWQLIGELVLGQNDYSSVSTGNMSHIPAMHTRWSALYPLGRTGAVGHWAWGPMVTAYRNDLQGTSSTGHLNHERTGTQLWASLHYINSEHRVEFSGLVRGTHKSHLTQTGAPNDIVNKQRHGWSMAHEYRVGGEEKPDAWRLRWRLTRLENSDFVGSAGWHVPRNQTLQFAVLKDF